MTATDIIEKLRPKLLQEGLEVDFLGREGDVVNIRAKRVAPGVPVAFLVKAIAGTYRRYLPEVQDVCLAEYDPGEAIGVAPSPTFEPVFKHAAKQMNIQAKGRPVVDLSGLDRRQAVISLENFFKLWKTKAAILGVQGLSEDAPLRAAKKWASVYRDDFVEIKEADSGRWDIVVSSLNTSENIQEPADEVMPGKIFLMGDDSE